MNVLVIGSGGREAALRWALGKSVFVKNIFEAPADIGVTQCSWCDSAMHTGKGLLASYATMNRMKDVNFFIIGPEAPLVAGIKEVFTRAGKAVFGPSRRAAELEGSKEAMKLFCKAYGIPTADFDIARTPEQAKAIVEKRGMPVVIKADGLAGGKGVKVADTLEEAFKAIDEISQLPAGKSLVIEECLRGWECSYIVLTDGKNVFPLLSAMDYKTSQKGEKENTGGMGCVAPNPLLTPKIEARILQNIIYPTIRALREEKRPFTGALYAGLMIINEQPYVLEYNCRLGDPETQTILPLLRGDILPYLYGTTNGAMSYRVAEWKRGASVCIVLAAAGYPGKPQLGDAIYGLEAAERIGGVFIFHAGTKRLPGEKLVTRSGRVLNVVGVGKTLQEARRRAYEAVGKIHFDGMWYREDIGSLE